MKLSYAEKVLANLHINPNFTTHSYIKGWSEQFFIDPNNPSEINPIEALDRGEGVLIDFTTSDLPALNTDIVVLSQGGQIVRANWTPSSGISKFDLASEFSIGKDPVGAFEVVKPTEFHQIQVEKQNEIGQLEKIQESWPVVMDPVSKYFFAGPKIVGAIVIKDFKLKNDKVVTFWAPIHASSGHEKKHQIQNFKKAFEARNQYDMAYMISKKYFGAQKSMIDGQLLKQSMLVSAAKQAWKGAPVAITGTVGFVVMVVKKV